MAMAPTNGREVARRGNSMDTFKQLFDKAKPSLAMVAPKHITPDRMIKVALVAISRTPKLMECSPESILKSFMQAGELGLDVGGALGHAYLVPFYNNQAKRMEAQFIVGYRGLIDLARRSGQIDSIEARVVYERDFFDCDYGLDPKLIHRPCMTGDRGKIIAAYAVARIKGCDRPQLELMTIDEIQAIRARSKAGNSGPWVSDFSEMSRKTVVRRLCKYLPLSVEMAQALDVTDTVEFGASGPVDYEMPAQMVTEDAEPASAADALADKLGGPITANGNTMGDVTGQTVIPGTEGE